MLTSLKSRRFQAKKWLALWIGCVFLKWGLGDLKANTQNVWYWDNNLGNSIWGGAFTKSQYNWDQNTTPEVVSGYPPIVVFDNTYIKSDQKILLQDTDKVVEGIYFMGPYSYSLYTDKTAKKITLDTGSSGNAYAFIGNLSNSCGDAKDHLIQTEVDAMSDVLLYNDAQGSLSFSNLFNIDKHNLWAYTLSQINMDSLAGYGSLEKYGSGSLTLSNSSVNFYGNTVLAEGSLSLRHGQGLGGDKSGEITVCDGASLELFNSGSVAYKTLNLSGNGLCGAGALNNVSGDNIWTGAINLCSTSSIGVSGGQLTVSGNISGSGGLTKVGAYSLVLTGNNTFTGTTTVNAGTLTLSGSGSNKALGGTSHVVINAGGTLLFAQNNQINSAANLTLNGGTLNTGGFTQTINVLTFSSNSTLILGAGPFHVSDVIRTGGILTISHYAYSGQFVATPGSIDQNTLNHIYFSDQGITGAFHLSNGCIVPAPEPATYGVILVVGSSLMLHYYKRRKALLLVSIET